VGEIGMIELKEVITKTEVVSDGNYRYSLKKTWDENKPKVVYILLNPSYANEHIIDRTFTFCMNYAVNNGFGQLEIVNLFALRTIPRDKKALKEATNPVGNENNSYILKALEGLNDKDLIIAGWGGDGGINKRNREVLRMLRNYKGKIKCFTDARNFKSPVHPVVLNEKECNYWLINFY
jgi:hypothetical protein